MSKLFEMNDSIPGWRELSQEEVDMFDFLGMKLMQKGLGRIMKVISCKPDTGTNNTPIFSGEFECEKGTAKVRCIHRRGILKKHHWAVYIKSFIY